MEPTGSPLPNLQEIIATIEEDINSLKSLNEIQRNQTVVFNKSTRTFSGEEKKKELHLYLPAYKELQDMRPTSPRKVIASLYEIEQKIHNDILKIGRFILKKAANEDLAHMRAIASQLLSLNRELEKAVSRDQGINVVTRSFKKQTEFSVKVTEIIKKFEKIYKAIEATHANLSDIIVPSIHETSKKSGDEPTARLPSIKEEDEDIGETYTHPNAPRIHDYFDDEPLEVKPAKDPFDNEELFQHFDAPMKDKSVFKRDLKNTKAAKDPFDDEELFRHFDLPSTTKPSLEEDTVWPETEKVKYLSNDSEEIQSIPAEVSEKISDARKLSKNKAAYKSKKKDTSTILPTTHSSLKNSPIDSWKIFKDEDGKEFCLIKISKTAFAKIPISGKNSTPLDIVKERYKLQDRLEAKS